jgi:haloalkane dehalogenase
MTKHVVLADYDKLDSQYLEVLGANIHYVQTGEGDPILFLHGIPTWSYIWRNIMPKLAASGHCIAPDFIGMGLSDKPDIDFSVFDHINYIEAFIEALGLENITLVMHGWGSVVGFHYAMRHPENIKGLAFLEAYVRPLEQQDMIALPMQQRASVLELADGGQDVISNSNYYVNKVMPAGVMRTLLPEELTAYQLPFQTPGSAKPIWQYLQELPGGPESEKVVELMRTYSKQLETSDIPKLMLYAMPGYNTSIETIVWAKENLPNLAVIEIDDALHYAQETHPHELAAALVDWYQTL